MTGRYDWAYIRGMEANTEETETLSRIGYVRMTEAMWGRLEELAQADERPVSYLVRIAVEQYLNRRKPAA